LEVFLKRPVFFLMLLLLFSGLGLFAQDRGVITVANENLGSSANVGKQYALFIAIDSYRS
jgi:hypothetical protein